MNRVSIKARLRELFLQRRLETGFSMLEAVVVVGVLLALAIGGLLAYGPITENAKKAKVKSAASEIHTAALVANIDGDPSTEPQGVIDAWNNSTDKIRVAILEPASGGVSSNGDICVEATNVESPNITARTGACDNVTEGSNPGYNPDDVDGDGIPNASDPDIDGDGTPNVSDPDADGDGIPNGSDPDGGGVIPDFSRAASIWYKPSLQSGNGRSWSGAAASADGSKLVATIDGGYIYTSTDFGRTWVERTAASGSFKSVASSADGSKLFAASTGDLWLSNDSGVNWAKIPNPGGTGWWTKTAMSADGTKLYVIDGQYGYYLWSSGDGGTTWKRGDGSGGSAWNTLSTSADGNIVLTGMLQGYYPYISRDSGATFLPITSLVTTSWRSSAVSADGTTLFVGGDAGRYVSRDTGVTWTKMPDDANSWYSPAISTDGSKWVVAKDDGYIYMSNDSGVTWRQQLEPGFGPFTRVALSADNTTVLASAGSSYGAIWIGSFGNIPAMPSSPAPDVFNTATWKQSYGINENWSSVASSADGMKLVSGGNSNTPYSNIFTSMDYGATWTKRYSSGAGDWNRFASSANGEKLAATQNNGSIFTSTDSGVTWTKQNSAGVGAWSSISSSYDGSKLVATQNGGGVYTSTDSGSTWTVQNGAGTGSWTSVASSADGTRIVAGNADFIYTSTDSGLNWTKRTAATGGSWRSVATSADGTKLIASQYPGPVWISTDSGATWATTGGASGYVKSVASSADGSKLVAAVSGGYIYTSKDGGGNWHMELDPTGANAMSRYDSWSAVTTSSDGSKMFAIGYQQGYYSYSSLWKGQY